MNKKTFQKKIMTQADWDEAIEKRRQGMTVEDLSKEYGISRQYMSRMTYPAVFQIDKGKAQALRDAGWSIVDIADECKVSAELVLASTTEARPRRQFVNEWNENAPDIFKSSEFI